MYAQKSSIKKLSALAASFPVSTSQDFSHPERYGSSCSLSFANNTHRSQTTTQVDGQMENEPLPFPLSDDCHMSFGMPLDLHAPEHRINHDKYDFPTYVSYFCSLIFKEKQLDLSFGSEDISNSTPKLLGFGRLAKIGESPWCLPDTPTCMHCGAIRFHREPPGFCCSNGQVSLSTLDVPEELRICSLSPRIGLSLLNDLIPKEGKGTNLQLYFHDVENEVDNRLAVSDKLKEELVLMIMKLLEANPYSLFFRSLREIPELHDYRIVLRADPGLDQRIYNVPVVDQVAAIWKDSDECDESQSRDIRVNTWSILRVSLQVFNLQAEAEGIC
ncbi:UNVERIFIED_CONTAM: hypothetical protein Sradi_2334700 [Sesamum radiatum]|uniref:Uncharacterized protein n=1 Tax=Sesamum radiatum TaxID=300843 RepID=A0AAW2T5A5_SESRA